MGEHSHPNQTQQRAGVFILKGKLRLPSLAQEISKLFLLLLRTSLHPRRTQPFAEAASGKKRSKPEPCPVNGTVSGATHRLPTPSPPGPRPTPFGTEPAPEPAGRARRQEGQSASRGPLGHTKTPSAQTPAFSSLLPMPFGAGFGVSSRHLWAPPGDTHRSSWHPGSSCRLSSSLP